MKLGILVGYSGKQVAIPIDLIKMAEGLGYDSAWTAEAYGSDAVTTATWILAQTAKIRVGTAIVQMPARTPACTAMTAMTLNQLSGGRFLLGIGPSGPQVVEGWHGVAYGRPLTRTREYVEILRKIMAREQPVEHDGYHYQLPYRGEDGTGLGKPLKSILAADTSIPIYCASITPKGIETAAEVADGFFPVWMNPDRYDLFEESIEAGFARRTDGKKREDFEIMPFVTVMMGDDLEQCRMVAKAGLALYIGGMGARSKNFYNDYAQRLGYEEEAAVIQDLYLDGKQGEATNAVPDQLVDDVYLCGPKQRILERLEAWKEAGARGEVSQMLLGCRQPEALEAIAKAMM
ncbi:MAG TPA: LLM class F420-dependent oxidoreductase [Thermoanaerobaculia bacterium]|nr:LLM class F420-dependent oxidoreductase [Thermoanaerobaculia bacterium]